MNIKSLIDEYQFMMVWRQAAILMLAAPVPAAVIKLQGTLLTSETIGFILIVGNIFIMATHLINKYTTWRQILISSNIISIMASGGTAVGYCMGVPDKSLLIYFPIVMGFSYVLLSLSSSKVKNILKNKAREEFDLSEYEAKKGSVSAFAAIVGQILAIAFYMTVDVNPMLVLVVLESVKTTIFAILEVKRYRLVSQIEAM